MSRAAPLQPRERARLLIVPVLVARGAPAPVALTDTLIALLEREGLVITAAPHPPRRGRHRMPNPVTGPLGPPRGFRGNE
jgi:hypothetical protein